MKHPQLLHILVPGLLMVLSASALGQAAGGEQPTDAWPEDDAPIDSRDDGAAATAPASAPSVEHAPVVPGPLVSVEPLPAPMPGPDPLEMPIVFDAATARLLPAGVILSSLGVDTGGGISSDLRIGLGDVAEFGVGTTDLIRVERCRPNCEYEQVSPYPLALFKMGLAEDRLFRNQPAVALGFKKSFEREHDGRTTRVAALHLVASKRVGRLLHLHAGGVFWDASIERGDEEVLLHDRGFLRQLRAFGGIEIEPLPKSRLMLELSWVPEFALGAGDEADKITLRPVFAWGVRYQLASWAMIESGVRIPNIKDVNLLDAQIFGQLRLVSHRFSRFLEDLN